MKLILTVLFFTFCSCMAFGEAEVVTQDVGHVVNVKNVENGQLIEMIHEMTVTADTKTQALSGLYQKCKNRLNGKSVDIVSENRTASNLTMRAYCLSGSEENQR